MLTHIDTLLFDLDGTLVDASPQCIKESCIPSIK